MKIGIPKEIKANEQRVSLVPSGVSALVSDGHTVIIESNAGAGSDFTNEQYSQAGARIANNTTEVWEQSDLIVKVKEPIESEWNLIKPGQVIFTYFHLAASRKLTEALIASGAVCIAYETVELSSGELPLLTPMSEIAGRMAVQEGAKYLECLYGGRGILLSGIPGVPPAKVVILGGGVVGGSAAKIAAALGANVIILDLSLERLRYLIDVMPVNVQLILSNRNNLLEQISNADLIIGAVLVHGAIAPKLIRRSDLSILHKGAVIVDVSIDQGGCVETMHPTTHENPIFILDGIVHYGVANMPGGVPLTATLALSNATLPYVLHVANKGYRQACNDKPELLKGLNIIGGKITYKKVAETFGMAYHQAESMF